TVFRLLGLALVLVLHLLSPSVVRPLLFGSRVLLFLLPLQVLPFLFLLLVHVLGTLVVLLIDLRVSAGWRMVRTIGLRHIVRMNVGRAVVVLRSAGIRRAIIARLRTVFAPRRGWPGGCPRRPRGVVLPA